jgi:toxin YoeB
MGKYVIEIKPIAEKHIKEHQKSGDQASIKKLEKIIKELSETPFDGIGKPEALKHELSGYWSRQINFKDRLIYKVDQEIVTVIVIAAKGHYFDN